MPSIIPNRKASQLKILVVNFQSIRNKKDELTSILLDNNIDAVLGSETHLTSSITDSEIMHPMYKCYRRDRDGGFGGVIIIIKKDLIVEELIKSKTCEFLAIKVQTHNQPIILATAYRPPSTTINETNNICKELANLYNKHKTKPLWFGGDTNLPDINWPTNSIIKNQYSKEINETFLETFSKCDLQQLVDFPTRRNNILDIVATNRPNLLNKCEPIAGMSDHETMVLLDIECYAKRSKPQKRKVFVWRKVDVKQLKSQVAALVTTFINKNTSDTEINHLWQGFKNIVDSSMSLIPTKWTSTRYSQPWVTRECKRMSRMKQRAYNRAKRTKQETDWNDFKLLVKTCKKAYASAYNQYIRECISPNIKNNPKKFFTFIKSKRCDNMGISPLKDKGILYTDDKDKANILNEQFSSVFSQKDCVTPTIPSDPAPSMLDIHVTESGVQNLLLKLNVFKATGPDSIPARFLNEVAYEITPALTLAFNASLDQGRTPDDWKQAIINPIYKPGKKDRSNPENYRPISLTCITCKILEHIVHSNIMYHLDVNKILIEVQHGFRKGRSCETQLITTVNDFAHALNEGQQLDTIILDFSKAFDKVDHTKLFLKLNHYGIRGKTLDWIKDFLSNRIQWVAINGAKSSMSSVRSGVPQGTVLGPLLFIVYINDLPARITSQIRLFADDSYIYRVINNSEDTLKLQDDITALLNWEREWSMEFHPDKCKLLRITNKIKIIEGDYYMHNIKLDQVNEAKYLGIILHKKLSWNPHVNTICSKANQTLAFLRRNIRECHRDVKIKCYHTYVRPILEYASAVWDPVGEGNQHLRYNIDMVQRKAARFVFNDWRNTSSPSKMIHQLNWKSLEERRYNARLTLMYKYRHNLLDVAEPVIVKARGKNTNFVPKQARIQAYANSFVPATIKDWNMLPPVIKNETDLNAFKGKINKL